MNTDENLQRIGCCPSRRNRSRARVRFFAVFSLVSVVMSRAAEPSANLSEQSNWADFVETNFPFFSSALDARKLGRELPADNLTPRGIILNLGSDCWACFDTD